MRKLFTSKRNKKQAWIGTKCYNDTRVRPSSQAVSAVRPDFYGSPACFQCPQYFRFHGKL